MKKEPLETKLAGLLKRKKITVAFAESCSGGLASSRITDIPGISSYFNGSVVAYSNDVKKTVLKIPGKVIEKHGAVSCETARYMAENTRKLLRSDIGASVTGIAGPEGGTRIKPVGLAYIAFADGEKEVIKRVFFKGSRAHLKRKFSDSLLKLVLDNIY